MLVSSRRVARAGSAPAGLEGVRARGGHPLAHREAAGRTGAEVARPVLGFFIVEPSGDTWPCAVRGGLTQTGNSSTHHVALTDELRQDPGWADSWPRAEELGKIRGGCSAPDWLRRGQPQPMGPGPAHRRCWLGDTGSGSLGGRQALGWGRTGSRVLSRGPPGGRIPQDPSPGSPLLQGVNSVERTLALAPSPGGVCAPCPGSWARGCFVPVLIGPSAVSPTAAWRRAVRTPSPGPSGLRARWWRYPEEGAPARAAGGRRGDHREGGRRGRAGGSLRKRCRSRGGREPRPVRPSEASLGPGAGPASAPLIFSRVSGPQRDRACYTAK